MEEYNDYMHNLDDFDDSTPDYSYSFSDFEYDDDNEDYQESVYPQKKPIAKRPSGSTKQTLGRNRQSYIARRRGRKGLKWILLDLFHNKNVRIIALAAILLIIVIAVISSCAGGKAEQTDATAASVVPATQSNSYRIEGIPVIPQDDLHAGCETYACTMLLQGLGFDIDEYEFVDNYLITRPVYYGEDGNLYGPDMNSAYAGDIYTGWGIYAPAMAKCMNSYIATTKSELRAYPLSGVSLEQLCSEYVKNDIPVMVWATTYMQEPYVKSTWIVDYADEDSKVKVGDTMNWQQNEHCMVLIGYDEKKYLFCDSVSGKVSAYDRITSEKRYSQIGEQAIVVK